MRSPPRCRSAVSGTNISPAAASAQMIMPAANGVTSGAGAHWASIPQSRTPAAEPPACDSVASNAARRGSAAGTSSASAAVAAPLSMPCATPSVARAANSHAVPVASANSSRPRAAIPSPMAITTRRPSRSESCPKVSSAGTRTRA
jgi:hypothetical protein